MGIEGKQPHIDTVYIQGLGNVELRAELESSQHQNNPEYVKAVWQEVVDRIDELTATRALAEEGLTKLEYTQYG